MQDALGAGPQKGGGIFAEAGEQNYRTLIELCPDALIVHDGEVIVLANLAMARLVGAASATDLVGCPVLDFVAPPSQALVEERIRRIHQAGETPLVDETWKRIDGTEVEVEVAARHVPWVAPRAAMVIVRDVTERRRWEAEREMLLAEKELLMQEVHHRAANSLQLVQGLLKLQARGSEDEDVRRQLSEASARIGTIGSLHSRLQNENSALEGDARAYMEGVVADLRAALGETYDRQILLDSCDAGTLVLKVDLLVALGLIAAEAVTNSIKHGAGHIRVRLAKSGTYLELSVEDEGAGFPENFNIMEHRHGLGMRMIASLIKSRDGRIFVGGRDRTDGRSSRITALIPF